MDLHTQWLEKYATQLNAENGRLQRERNHFFMKCWQLLKAIGDESSSQDWLRIEEIQRELEAWE